MSQAVGTRDLRQPSATCDGEGCRLKIRALPSNSSTKTSRAAVSSEGLSPEEEVLLRSNPEFELREVGPELVIELGGDGARDSELTARFRAASANATAPKPTPLLMGVVNATPDSFSDGGAYYSETDPSPAIEHALGLAGAGCDLLDIGGESTRPGALPVSTDEELRRVIPLITAIRSETPCRISIDTQKAAVAAAAIDAGATMVNDVSAGRADKALLPLVAERGVEVCLMHMRGTPRDMQKAPAYDDVVREVLDHLRERAHACLKVGIDGNKILIDPGIGFGKALDHNLELLSGLPILRSLGLPLLLGVSRKSFIAQVTANAGVEVTGGPRERLGGTIAALLRCVDGGASILRVHDVSEAREALLVHNSLTPESS